MKRRVTTKSNSSQDNLEEVKASFLSEVVETVDMNDIPPELIFKTCINLVPTALWTMDKRGKKELQFKTTKTNDRLQLSCVVVLQGSYCQCN